MKKTIQWAAAMVLLLVSRARDTLKVLVVIAVFAVSTAANATIFVKSGDPGYYNNSIGMTLNGTNGGNTGPFPVSNYQILEFPTAPDLSAAGTILGNWLTDPLNLNSNWSYLSAIPNTWAADTEVAVIYKIDTPQGASNVFASFIVDNGISVWLDGTYLFGARYAFADGHYDVQLGNLSAGTHFLQLILEDHGGTTHYGVQVQEPVVQQDYLAGVVLMPVNSGSVNYGPGTMTKGLISVGVRPKWDPHVDGDLVSYSSFDGGFQTIHYYRFSSGVDQVVPTRYEVINSMAANWWLQNPLPKATCTAQDYLSDVQGGRITLDRSYCDGTTGVMLFNVTTASFVDITPTATPSMHFYGDQGPGQAISAGILDNWNMHTVSGQSIGGNTVAFSDQVSSSGKIFVWDALTQTTTQLTNDTRDNDNPKVSPSGDSIVWENCDAPYSYTGCDIMMAQRSGTGWAATPVANSALNELEPDTNGTYTVWRGGDATNGYDIYWVGGGSAIPHRLELPGDQLHPHIAGGVISFLSKDPVTQHSDIYLYEIASNRLFQLTNTPTVDEGLSDLTLLFTGELRMVWEANNNTSNSNNIYGATFTLPALPLSNYFMPAGNLGTEREEHTATKLGDGKVLIAGGRNASGVLSSAELYDETTDTFTPTGAMGFTRLYHTATLLPNGKVLITGGETTTGAAGSLYLTSDIAELYDPATGAFTLAGNMTTARSRHTATLLSNGEVLIAGGYSGEMGFLSSVELYDPVNNTFRSAPFNMTRARAEHSATLYPGGNVLIAGGHDGFGYSLTTETYHMANGLFEPAGDMVASRWGHSATFVSGNTAGGKVLIVGGLFNSNANPTTELYDPITRSFSWNGFLSGASVGGLNAATMLYNGQVLFTGGNEYNSYWGWLDFIEQLYDPATNVFTPTGQMLAPRFRHTATLLNSGRVLVTGGQNYGAQGVKYLSSAELYGAFGPDLTVSAFTTSPGPHLTGERIFITATVTNNGDVPAKNFVVSLYEETGGFRTTLQDCQIADLAAGASTTCKGSVSYDIPATYNLWAYADYYNTVLESDESNNLVGPLLEVVIYPSPTILTTLLNNRLPDAIRGVPYFVNLEAGGGTAPYTFAVVGLPAGLTLNGASIEGTPTVEGTYSLSIGVTDANQMKASSPATLAMLPNIYGVPLSSGTLIMTVPPSQTITQMTFTQPTTTPPPGINFMSGTLSYTVTLPAGQTTSTASINMPSVPVGTSLSLYKTNHAGVVLGVIPVCDGINIVSDCWSRQDTINETIITLILTDNGSFDLNPAVGIIVDPVLITTDNPPVANAGPDQNIYLGQTATLTGAASTDPNGDSLTYTWILDAAPLNSTATLAGVTTMTPSLTPDVTGAYHLSLVVNDGTLDSAASPVMINVSQNLPPVAAATGTPTSGYAPLLVAFDASTSTDPEGSALSYSWNFGDPASGANNLSASMLPTHSYAAAGNYTAVVTVTDNFGKTDQASVAITVTAPNLPPVVLPTATPNHGAALLDVQFTANATDVNPADVLGYSWNFGDGSPLTTLANPQHTYSAGTYTATVTVSDGVNAPVSASLTISVSSALTIHVTEAKVERGEKGRVEGRVSMKAHFDFAGVDIAWMPTPTDLIRVTFDGVVLIEVPFSSFKQEGSPSAGKYEYESKTVEAGLDFKNGKIKVSRHKMLTNGIDSSNGIDVEINFGSATGTDHVEMKGEKGRRDGDLSHKE